MTAEEYYEKLARINEWPIRGFVDLFSTPDERRREIEEILERSWAKKINIEKKEDIGEEK